MKKHNKHAKIPRPSGGDFHRIELGFLGAPCGTIQKLCALVAESLSPEFSLAYVDADHGEASEFEGPYTAELRDKISFKRFDLPSSNPMVDRLALAQESAVLVNGNHFKTAAQIVILNADKRDSLRRKLDRLNDIKLVILDEGCAEPFDFLSELLQGESTVPVCRITDTKEIAALVKGLIKYAQPVLKGLVLTGGKSERMGFDKGTINYHGKAQREVLAAVLSGFGLSTALSIRSGQDIESGYALLEDRFTGLGPMGAILTAFQCDPDSAYLVVPCDAPHIDAALIKELLDNRDTNKYASCFYNPKTDFPEPLISIWEPRIYPVMLQWLARGYSCPRKVLINSEVALIRSEQSDKLFNANTVAERNEAMLRIKMSQRTIQ